VTVPAEIDPAARVRCPWCAALTSANDALSFVPPALAPIDERAEAPAALAVGASAAAAMHPSGAGDELDELHFSPLDPLSDQAGQPDEPAGTATSFTLDDLEFDAASPTESSPFSQSMEEMGQDQLDFDAASTESGEQDTIDFSSGESNEVGGPVAGRTQTAEAPLKFDTRSPARRQRREPSALGNLIGVLLAAPVGLGLGYFVLLWIGGPEKDFLGYGSKLPSWMVPASFSKPRPASGLAAAASRPQPASKPAPNAATSSSADQKPNSTAATDNDSEALDKPVSRSVAKPPVNATDDEPAADTSSPAASSKSAIDDASADPDDKPAKASDQPKGNDEVAADPPAKSTDESTNKAATAPRPAHARDVPPPPERPGPRAPVRLKLEDLERSIHWFDESAKELAAANGAAKEEKLKLKRAFYRGLYHVAGIATFAAEEEKEADVEKQRQAARERVVKLASDPLKFKEMGMAAAQWLARAEQRGSEQGVVLAGTVQEISQRGKLQSLKLQLAGGDQTVLVVSDRPFQVKAADEALVLGSIIEKPADAIVGFQGDETQVVWLGTDVKHATAAE
jgi:hypothetical protein